MTIATIHIIMMKQVEGNEKNEKNEKNETKTCFTWGLSSAGRASALQAEGHRFEPYRPHEKPNMAE